MRDISWFFCTAWVVRLVSETMPLTASWRRDRMSLMVPIFDPASSTSLPDTRPSAVGKVIWNWWYLAPKARGDRMANPAPPTRIAATPIPAIVCTSCHESIVDPDVARLKRLAKQISDAERKDIGDRESELKSVTGSQDYKAILHRIEVLNQASMRLAELMMDSAVSSALKGKDMRELEGDGPEAPHRIAPAEIRD